VPSAKLAPALLAPEPAPEPAPAPAAPAPREKVTVWPWSGEPAALVTFTWSGWR